MKKNNVNMENVVAGVSLTQVVDNLVMIDMTVMVNELVNGCLNVEKLYQTVEEHVINDLVHKSELLKKLCLLGSCQQVEDYLEEAYKIAENLTGNKVMFINNTTREYTIFASTNYTALNMMGDTMKRLLKTGLSDEKVDMLMCTMEMYKAA